VPVSASEALIVVTPAPEADLRRCLFQIKDNPPIGNYRVGILVDNPAQSRIVLRAFVTAYPMTAHVVREGEGKGLHDLCRSLSAGEVFCLNGTCWPGSGCFEALRQEGVPAHAGTCRLLPNHAAAVGEYATEFRTGWAEQATREMDVTGCLYLPPGKDGIGVNRCYGARVYGTAPVEWESKWELTGEQFDNRAAAGL
jgi:hypothetical protein